MIPNLDEAAKVAKFEGELTAKFEKWVKQHIAYFRLDDTKCDEETLEFREKMREWLLFTYAHAYSLGYNECIGNLGRTFTKAYNDTDIKF